MRPAAVATVAAAVVLSLTPSVSAAVAPGTTHWKAAGHGAKVVVKGVKGDGHHTVVQPADRTGRRLSSGRPRKGESAAMPHLLSATNLSTIHVNYDANFNANTAAKAAFGAAVAIWERAVASPVTIEVDASLATLGPGVLGGAGPTEIGTDSTLPQPSFAYPIALANALHGADFDSLASDITAQFSSDTSFWYFGTDGIVPAGKYDFESVVLHELGHGLGFVGSVEQVSSNADYSSPPFIYDAFTETGDGTPVLAYPNNSAALTAAVTSDAVYWAGPNGASADHGRDPRLYAPTTGFEPGSSYSHVDDTSYPQGDPDSLMTPAIASGEAIHDPGEVMLGMFRDMGWVTPGLPGSRYTPLPSPVRVLNTGSTRVANGASQTLFLASHFGVPSNATAAVLNVTGVSPLAADDVRAFPISRALGAPLPQVSNLNNGKGETRANLVTVPISAGGPLGGSRSGRVALRVNGGATVLIADLEGYYAPAATTYFHPLAPVRILDTRNGSRVLAGSPLDLKVTAANGVPAGAAAVAMTVTAVRPTAATNVSVYPTGPPPSSSSLNLAKGRIVANQVVTRVGTGGQVRFKNAVGSTDLIADLVGWYDTNSIGGTLFRPTLPTRLVDTRPGKVGPAGVIDIGIADSPTAFNGVPTTAAAAVVNVTGVAPTLATDLRAFPTPASGTAFPTVSNVNMLAGQTAASLATVKLGSQGRIRVRNSAGQVAVIVDLSGWFGPA